MFFYAFRIFFFHLSLLRATKSPGKWGFLLKNVCKKLENGEQKGAPYKRNAFVLTRNSIHIFQHLSNIFFQIFSGISECAKCSAFVFRYVHILFMIHSKNFHSLIMPNSFFPFILQNVKNVAEIFHWHLIHMSFSQYFNTIWIYFFHNCQAALCLASSLFRAFFIFSFLCTQGSLLRLR